MTTKITIFIDESGTLPDPKDQVVIVAAIGTNIPNKLTHITKVTRKYLRKSNKNISEIKFYKSGEKTKKKFLQELAKQQLEIFTLTIQKEGQKITDSPDNFAILCWFLLEDCLLFYQNQVSKVIFDQHFHRQKDQIKFNQKLTELLGQKFNINHVDSQKEPGITAADMIAGSMLWLKTGKDQQFYHLFKKLIISEKVINWKQIKKIFFNKKISLNRCKHPSKRD